MVSEVEVSGTVEDGVRVLIVSYGPEQMFQRDASSTLSRKLVSEYHDLGSLHLSSSSCVVVIEAQTAGSALLRALFELYKEVTGIGGQLICAGYPSDYLEGITSSGLSELPGFILASDKREALKKASAK
jgi:hypothetical protein